MLFWRLRQKIGHGLLGIGLMISLGSESGVGEVGKVGKVGEVGR